ncbi:MAG TPA: asparagine synthase (glutamine-hydrolyzing) [Vicinamibacteria bacterium]|nr:asparagine synthase (glutamine-hydrolyzing) [Vicinamibacteria bacterium]
MCGIAGIAARDPELLRPLAAMTRALRHRGPDDEGYLLVDSRTARAHAYGGTDTLAALGLPALPRTPVEDTDVALGHRRLAIIDLSPAGHGPMVSADGRLAITYNGEIFNYLELREELKAGGHRFRTGSDTEVLLAAYAEWGPAALHRLNGMWAFALYDARERRLFCARDRFGVKPFFFFGDGPLFAFASEIKGLLAHPACPRAPHETILTRFLALGAVDETSDSFVAGIRSLPAGHQLTFDLAERRSAVERWYQLPDPDPRPGDPAEFRALLEDAVRLRLRSDVEVGTCLSGGLDSSSLVAITARWRASDGGLGRRAVSVVYPDPEIRESAHVDTMVAASGVTGHRTTPTAAEFAADLPGLAGQQDEPFPSPGVYSQWRVMRLAREAGLSVLLDGQGADEVLAGYHYHFGPFLAEVVRQHGLRAALRQARLARQVTGRGLGFFLGLLVHQTLPLPAPLRAWAVRRGAGQGRVPPGLLAPELRTALGGSAAERHRPRPSLAAERRANILTTSLPALLRYEDRNSMAFSIEARTPFLDYRLVERALALPASDLIRDGWTKALLRDAMTGVLPESVRLRRDKLGFATPETRWLVELAPQVRDWLGPSSRLRSRLDSRGIRRWLALPDGALARQPGLFRLLSAELWLRALETRRAA